MDFPEHLEVKRFGYLIPVSAEALIDAGLPLPDGMEPPPASPPVPWQKRLRWAWRDFLWNSRRRVGFWIAGYEPEDDWW
jgi:hypothetical protein